MIIKGLKGDFKPIIDWYKELFSLAESLIQIMQKEIDWQTASIQILDIIKAGLFSHTAEVELWTSRLLAKIASEMNKRDMGGVAWEWFIADNGGLQGIIRCYNKNHHITAESVISVMYEFSRYNFAELLTHYMKSCFHTVKEYMQAITVFMLPLSEYKNSRDEIVNGKILLSWIEIGSNSGDIGCPDIQERVTALTFLVECWICFPNAVEANAEFTDIILRLLQRASRDRIINIQLHSMALQFKLMDIFANEKNPFAVKIYKTLTFSVIENHQKAVVREFLMNNFKASFESISSIPIRILIEPLIKAVQTNSINDR